MEQGRNHVGRQRTESKRAAGHAGNVAPFSSPCLKISMLTSCNFESSARRLRCDEQKPKCIRCTKVNLVCNGLGFAGGIHASRPAVVKISESTVPMIPVNSPQLHSSRAVRDILDLLPAMFGEMKKVDAVNPLTKAIRIQGVVFCSYLEYLPPTAGYNMALDSTTKCVSSALRDYVRYTSSTSGKVTAVPWGTKTLLLYTSALKHLASGLNDEVQSVSIEVLCATILLQSLEVGTH